MPQVAMRCDDPHVRHFGRITGSCKRLRRCRYSVLWRAANRVPARRHSSFEANYPRASEAAGLCLAARHASENAKPDGRENRCQQEPNGWSDGNLTSNGRVIDGNATRHRFGKYPANVLADMALTRMER